MSNHSCTITQSNDYFEFEGYVIDFEAEATSIHEDMVKYYPDGSGYPGYDGIEDVNWTFNSVTDEDGNELELGDDGYPIAWDEETKKRCEEELNTYLDHHDWDYPEWDDEPPDPEPFDFDDGLTFPEDYYEGEDL